MPSERLQKIIAAAGIASRRKSEELITSGRVQVNGQVVTELGSKADPEQDHIRVDGKLLQGPERFHFSCTGLPDCYGSGCARSHLDISVLLKHVHHKRATAAVANHAEHDLFRWRRREKQSASTQQESPPTDVHKRGTMFLRAFYEKRVLPPRRTIQPGLHSFAATAFERHLKVAIFSKHLQFVEGDELARVAAGMGFDGIDVTVRAGGHVDPARVAEDLPALVTLIRRNGLEVPMVTTDIVDAASPNAKQVLRTLSSLGIRYYRWGGFKYRDDQQFTSQLEEFHARAAGLAALNHEYKVCAIYHTHSGLNLVGAPVWDIFQILKGLDPDAVAINYDVGHATVEGGLAAESIASASLSRIFVHRREGLRMGKDCARKLGACLGAFRPRHGPFSRFL